MIWFMFSQLIIIGEAANRIDKTTQSAHPSIPWKAAIATRHRLIHGYDSVDWKIVYTAVKQDLPGLILELSKIVPVEYETS